MFERSAGGDRVVLVHPQIENDPVAESEQEFIELAEGAGAAVQAILRAPRARPDAAYFVGTGKVEEIAQAVKDTESNLVLVNHLLSPIQERNLEKAIQCRVHDRTTLILDIFAQRAATHEGKLQVELAQLRHLSTRLVRGWTHLERQKGGIGLRGPGETQLETDRRLLAERVKALRKRLDKVKTQRDQTRRGRLRSGTQTVSLVGYTNAGKSTLFNAMTEGEVYTADQLFATLDPTRRRFSDRAVLADTVGFIRHLPHDLIAAFRATLEESRDADLLLHVIDSAAPDRDELVAAVEDVLEEIGADDVPVVKVYNKTDLSGLEPRIIRNDEGLPISAYVSAATGAGLDELRDAIDERLHGRIVDLWYVLPPSESRLRAELHEMGAVTEERFEEDGGMHLHLRMHADQMQRWNDRLAPYESGQPSA